VIYQFKWINSSLSKPHAQPSESVYAWNHVTKKYEKCTNA